MRILLVDDDVDCLDSLYGAFAMSVHKCEKFSSSEEALRAYQKQKYEVVISDIKMPELSGIEFLQKVRKLHPEARVIMTTGYEDIDTAIDAVNYGAYAYFSKPIDINALMEAIDKIEAEIGKRERSKKLHARLAQEYSRLKDQYEG